MARLRVWSTDQYFDNRVRNRNGSNQCEAIVATTSKKRAREILGLSSYAMDTYAGETQNDGAIAVATPEPGVLWIRSINEVGDGGWMRG